MTEIPPKLDLLASTQIHHALNNAHEYQACAKEVGPEVAIRNHKQYGAKLFGCFC